MGHPTAHEEVIMVRRVTITEGADHSTQEYFCCSTSSPPRSGSAASCSFLFSTAMCCVRLLHILHVVAAIGHRLSTIRIGQYTLKLPALSQAGSVVRANTNNTTMPPSRPAASCGPTQTPQQCPPQHNVHAGQHRPRTIRTQNRTAVEHWQEHKASELDRGAKPVRKKNTVRCCLAL